jgi:hypothetical protein
LPEWVPPAACQQAIIHLQSAPLISTGTEFAGSASLSTTLPLFLPFTVPGSHWIPCSMGEETNLDVQPREANRAPAAGG